MEVEVTGIDHLYVAVSDLERSQRFYDRVMAVLVFRKVARPLAGGDLHVHYFNRITQLSLRPARSMAAHDSYAPGLHHLCFRVPSEADVDTVARELGKRGIDATPPRGYPEYHADYYATFFSDPDGIRLEVVNHMEVRKATAENWERPRVAPSEVHAVPHYPRDGLRGARPADLAWLSGSWYADHDGGMVEEHWIRPGGGMMMAMFRWIRDSRVLNYEIEALETDGELVYLRIRHFDPGCIAWEEKDAPLEFVLVQHDEERLVFHEQDVPDPRWTVYERRGPDELVVYFTRDSEPDPHPGVFHFMRRA